MKKAMFGLALLLLGATALLAQDSAKIKAQDYLLAMDLGSRAEARSLLVDAERSLQAAPGDPVALQHQGVALLVLGRLDEAIVSLQDAEANGAGSAALLPLGEAYMRLEKFSAAAGTFLQVTEEEGEFTALGYFLHGLVMDRNGRSRKAIASYVKALRRDPRLRLENHNPHVVQARSIDLAIVKVLGQGGESSLTMPMEGIPAAPGEGTVEAKRRSGRVLNPWKRNRMGKSAKTKRTTPNQKAAPAAEPEPAESAEPPAAEPAPESEETKKD